MKKLLLSLFLGLTLLFQACSKELSPGEKQMVDALRSEYQQNQDEIRLAANEDSLYPGGLIKALLAIRLEILKTNGALIQQRIHAIEGKAKVNLVVNYTKPDSVRALELAKEIAAQKVKIAEARAQADRYSGGLVQAMAEVAVATERSTLAMLQQQYVVARYGVSLPSIAIQDTLNQKPVKAILKEGQDQKATPAQKPRTASDSCLKIKTYDSSILSSNDVFTEVAWKVDVGNACSEQYQVQVKFTLYDKDEFELDSDDQTIYVPPNGVGKARGKMLVSPPEKARRMAKQGVSVSIR